MNLRITTALLILFTALGAAALPTAHASLDGIPNDLPIRSKSRPCCAFIPSFFTRILGLSGFMNPENLGRHDFAHLSPKKTRDEKFGAVYTCRAGFLDLSHLRDNADWTAQIYLALRSNLGSGKSIAIDKEGGSEETTLELPRLTPEELARLTPEDLEKIAMALSFDLSLFHEIATGFPMAVSGTKIPILSQHLITERNSSFSVEDSYSNLLGTHLGREAIRSPLPFNDAMTEALRSRVQAFDARSPEETRQIFRSLKGTWWKKGGYKAVRRRVYDYRGTLLPRLADSDTAQKICGTTPSDAAPLEIMDVERITGRPHQEIAYFRIKLSREFSRKLKKLGTEAQSDGFLTRDDFSEVIPLLRARYSKKISGLLAD